MWGQLLKTGYQNSRFAHQVERFACLYTSHVSNLTFYSPDKSYRWVVQVMASTIANPAVLNLLTCLSSTLRVCCAAQLGIGELKHAVALLSL